MIVAHARPGLVKVYFSSSYLSSNISDRLVVNPSPDESLDVQNPPCMNYDKFWSAIFEEGRKLSSEGIKTKYRNKTYFRGEL